MGTEEGHWCILPTDRKKVIKLKLLHLEKLNITQD